MDRLHALACHLVHVRQRQRAPMRLNRRAMRTAHPYRPQGRHPCISNSLPNLRDESHNYYGAEGMRCLRCLASAQVYGTRVRLRPYASTHQASQRFQTCLRVRDRHQSASCATVLTSVLAKPLGLLTTYSKPATSQRPTRVIRTTLHCCATCPDS